LSGYHHSSSRYKIVNGKAILERLDGLYLNEKKCTYTKYSIKNGKQKKILEKKLPTNKAEQMNYYSDEGSPIKFKKQ
jgi:hemolysin-activating ACP:hemolysin acyltransferase